MTFSKHPADGWDPTRLGSSPWEQGGGSRLPARLEAQLGTERLQVGVGKGPSWGAQ